MSRLRVFICAPLTDAGRLAPKAVEAYRFVAVHADKDLGRAGFACLCDPEMYDDKRVLDETYIARALEEAKAWIQISDIFLRLPGQCIEADQRECFARAANVIIVSSVRELITKMSNG